MNRQQLQRRGLLKGLVVSAGAAMASAVAPGVFAQSDGSPVRHPLPFAGTRPGQELTVAGVRFCWCPAGEFVMGSPLDETGRRTDEAQVNVTLSRGYWMAKYETTQRQWLRVMGAFPDKPATEGFGVGDNVPVYWVSYLDAEAFCARLNERARNARALPADWEFRLPTEAQWEYACRAGTTTATHYGNVFGFNHANFGSMPLNGGEDGVPHGRSIDVGQYAPNGWGIYDMHGNIFELCRDYYHARLPGGVDPDLYNTPGARNGDGTYSRVRRGGAWIEEGRVCRSAARFRYEPHRNSDHIGFRVVIVHV